MPDQIKAADYIASYLHQQGVTHIYEVIGGMITHLVDAVHRQGKIRIISMHHEQGAAFAVDGHGRMTQIPVVAMATSGPGATNLLTGIGSCFFDSVPAVFITGQVNRHEQKGSRPIRQLGFQETDIVAIARPITKGAFAVDDPESLPEILAAAFALACNGRPGPVLVDIPMDVQNTPILVPPPTPPAAPHQPTPTDGKIGALLKALQSAERPLILIGGGVHSAGAGEAVRKLASQVRIPVVASLMAIDVLPYSDPLRVGFLGSYGNRWANHAIGSADVIAVLGSRLDIRQTGADTAGFKAGRRIFHVDIEAGEVNNRITGCTALISHLLPFTERLIEAAGTFEWPERSCWLENIRKLRAEFPDTAETDALGGINPNTLMHRLSRTSLAAGAFVADVGQHQMWAAQSLELAFGQRFITSGGMGAMGYALPAAIGAAFACEKPVVVIAGDGGFQLNIQELETVAHLGLPLKMVILNNRCHGMVRQFQQSYFKERYQSTLDGYSAPDFEKVARAYAIESTSVSDPAQLDAALAELWADPTIPYLLQVHMDPLVNVYPKIAYGHPLTEMEPFAQPLEMEGT